MNTPDGNNVSIGVDQIVVIEEPSWHFMCVLSNYTFSLMNSNFIFHYDIQLKILVKYKRCV